MKLVIYHELEVFFILIDVAKLRMISYVLESVIIFCIKHIVLNGNIDKYLNIPMSSTVLVGIEKKKGRIKLIVLLLYSSFLPRSSKSYANNVTCPGQGEVMPKVSQFNKWEN